MDKIGQKPKDTNRNRLKDNYKDRNRKKQTETNRHKPNGQKLTETDLSGQKRT